MENDGKNVFTEEQEEQISRENPLGFGYHASVTVNGTVLSQKSATGSGWNPCVLDRSGDITAALRILHHYGLDKGCGWSFRRICFPWVDGAISEIEDLSITLSAEKSDYTAGSFTAAAGDVVEITHPVTGEGFELTVCEVEQHILELNTPPEDDTVYPTCYTAMTYEVAPPMDRRRLQLRDTGRGDSPIRKGRANGSMGIAIIHGDDQNRCTAVSSLTFAPRETVEWRVVFHESEYEDTTVELYRI